MHSIPVLISCVSILHIKKTGSLFRVQQYHTDLLSRESLPSLPANKSSTPSDEWNKPYNKTHFWIYMYMHKDI